MAVDVDIHVEGVTKRFGDMTAVDDLTLSIVPMLLGQGVPLFGQEVPEQLLVLKTSKSYESGLVQLCYSRASAERG